MASTKETKKQKAKRLYNIGWSIRDIAQHLNSTQEWVTMLINDKN